MFTSPLVILQGPTWFDAHRVQGIKQAAVSLKLIHFVLKSTTQYDIPGLDDSPYSHPFLLDITDLNAVQNFFNNKSFLSYRLWTSSEELTFLGASLKKTVGPSRQSSLLGMDKDRLKTWLQSEGFPTLPGFRFNQNNWSRENRTGIENTPMIIKPRTGRGAISKKPWHYKIVSSLKDLENSTDFNEALSSDDSLVEQFIGFGTTARFYDVHVWFGSSEPDVNVYLIAEWQSASDGRIQKSFGPVKPKPEILHTIRSVAVALFRYGYRLHLANLQFAEFNNQACLIDFNTRSAGVWAMIQPTMAPNFYQHLLEYGKLPSPVFSTGLSHYEKNPFPLETGKVLQSISWPNPEPWIKLAYCEKLVPGYETLATLNSLQPNPQVTSFGKSLKECETRFVEFKNSVKALY